MFNAVLLCQLQTQVVEAGGLVVGFHAAGGLLEGFGAEEQHRSEVEVIA